ncbi:Mitochondrial inner membrane i-AAA protease supercomplex subunit YME1 [Golovinomyces cichoracearum]|uniref:Mitochondrial inner membrane i-AAA protease supercomplex subunit YME1 n=1 Tax=Golovinomyces cichoracearum TaxID=62708 RepID=A0A420HM91_9PEZI|nr:Mitochondrial inner membrane i-AAA protease supercomplex subunit YME1 [Golovinomyces cichoracearum]
MNFQSVRPVVSSTIIEVVPRRLAGRTLTSSITSRWNRYKSNDTSLSTFNRQTVGDSILRHASNIQSPNHVLSHYEWDLARQEMRSASQNCRNPMRSSHRSLIGKLSHGPGPSSVLMSNTWPGSCLQARYLTSIRTLKEQSLSPIIFKLAKNQSRKLTGFSSKSNLVFLEENANKYPNDANKQYTFYQALSRANRHAIIIERYLSNKFAANTACENIYQQALRNLNPNLSQYQVQPTPQAENDSNLSRLQAISQAVAANSKGGSIANSRPSVKESGDKNNPIHVVVEESVGVMLFRMFKFVSIFGFIVYFCMALVTLVIDSLQSVKKVGGKSETEAKAEQQNIRFSDVHGCDEAKEELVELVEFLKNPERFSALGGKLPKGVLLVGPPGTGKTLLARAVAGEAGVPFFFMSGSEFDEIYVGVGAKRVRELFAAAKSKSPAIVFIDELDAIGGKRNARDSSYAKQTLNQLLTELDGFDQNSGVIILGATNFPESLDKALTRPGRFDRNVVVDLPDVRGRMAILKHHMKNVLVSDDVSVEVLAAGTPGFSGAELENIINQAAVRASKAKSSEVSMLDFEWAKDKLMMGAEKRSMLIPEKEKELTAYHEAGHALVLMFTRGADPLHKVTIMPRGQALGITFHLPEMDKYSKTVEEYRATIDVCMGGKVAEELVFGPENVTSGCSSDLTQATKAAYAMVASFGMSKELGHVDLASNYENLSAGTKQKVELEVRRTLEDGYERAKKLIINHEKELHLLAKALLKYEMLDREEAFKVIKGEVLEGKAVISSGSIKLPEMGIGLAPALPSLPGTMMDPPAGKEPPQGDVGI